MTVKDYFRTAYLCSITTQVACIVVIVIPALYYIHNASGNDAINDLRGKNVYISRFGGRRKLKPGQKLFFHFKFFQIQKI